MKRSAKRGLSWLLSLLMLVTMLPLGSVDTWAQETDETVPDGVTYIATKEELSAVRENPAGQYVLTQDIVFTPDDFEEGGAFYNDGAGWEPIGTRDVPFTGTFDGNGHAIEGLTLSKNNRQYAGLFGYVQGGQIQDLYLKNLRIQNVYTYSQSLVGGIAGYLRQNGIISGCAVSDSSVVQAASKTSLVGGITGWVDETSMVVNCLNQSMVTGGLAAGGIVGVLGGNVSNSCNTGKILATASNVKAGAIAGYVGNEGVTGCYYLNNMDRGAGGGPDTAIACTQEEMAQAETFSLFDFDVFWFMEEGAAYPQLRALSGVAPKKQVTELTIVSLPDQREYRYEMADSMHLEGGLIQLTFQDGTQKIMPMVSAIVTGLELNQEGEQTLTVSYAGRTDTFTVHVTDVYPQFLEIESLPQKTRYLLHGGEKLDVTGGQIWVIMNNGRQEIVDMTPDMITGFDDSMLGTNTLTVSYAWGWAETTFDVTICEEDTTEFAGGIGSESYPYKISTKEQLDHIREHLDASFVLTDDVVFTPDDFAEGGAFYNSGAGWEPIGNWEIPFTGTFNGNGHAIEGMNVSMSETTQLDACAGLFGKIEKATIQNVRLTNNIVKGDTQSGRLYVGSMAGYAADSLIQACSSDGTVEAVALAEMSNVYAGGLLGGAEDITVQDSWNTGDVSAVAQSDYSSRAGGLVGSVFSQGSMNRCFSTGNVFSGDVAGGLIGSSCSKTVLQDCFQTGHIIGGDWVGGITGEMDSSSSMARCYQAGLVESIHPYSHSGGLAGAWEECQASNCYYWNQPGLEGVGYGGKAGTGCTAEELQDPSTFQGFDFETLWIMEGNKTYLYPKLPGFPSVFEQEPQAIFVTTLPTITSYVEGKDTLDVSGGEITRLYTGGLTETLPLTQEMVTGFDNSQVGPCRLTVTYQGLQTDFDVDILPKSLVAITMETLPERLTYLEGRDSLDISGGMIKLWYDNDTFETIPLTKQMVTGFDNSQPGTQELTVTYAGKTTVFTVEIEAKTLLSIEMNRNPDKMSYLEGLDTLDVTGGSIRAHYDNGSLQVVPLTVEMVSGFDNSQVGTQTLTVTYGGKTTVFWVTIEEKSVASIEMETLPYQLTYLEGKSSLDLTGGQVKVFYNNGTSEIIPLRGWMVEGFDNHQVGPCTLTVTYYQKTTSFTVQIAAKSLVSIEMETYPTKTSYLEGKESLDVTGGQLRLLYNNDTEDVVPLTEEMVSGFDSFHPGSQWITVTYKEKTTKFLVSVLPKALVSIKMETLPHKTSYLEEKEVLDVTGGQIRLYYNNGTEEVIPLTTEMVTGFDNGHVGKKKLTVTYEGLKTSFEIWITQKSILSISMKTLPEKREYLQNQEELDVTGGQLFVAYNNDTHEVIGLTKEMVSGFDNSQTGEIELTVHWGGQKTSFSVTIQGENATDFDGGFGTESNPFEIATKEQLSRVREYPDCSFVLTQDIAFTPDDFEEGGAFYNGGAGWEPIGTRDVPFTGTFDGNGHAIKGLTVTASSHQDHIYAGLFGYVSGTVKDIGRLTGTVMAENGGSFDTYAGGVAGLLDGGTVNSCHSDMMVTARSLDGKAYAGGITGGLQNDSTLTACRQGGIVQAETGDYDYSYAGGITGMVKSGTVSVCLNTGAVTAIASEQGTGDGVSYVYAGGIAGLFSSGTAENIFNMGSVRASGPWSYAGGLAGYSGGHLQNGYNVGQVETTSKYYYNAYAGGIAGRVASTPATHCYYLDIIDRGAGTSSSVCDLTACTSQQMQKAETFRHFDFDSVWVLQDSGYRYPQLRGVETVYEPVPQRLTMTQLPDKTVYVEGTDSLDLTGGQITLLYNDGNTEVIDLTEDMVTGFNDRYIGEQTLLVTYAGLTTTFSVTVKEITSLQTPSVSLTNSTDGVKISWKTVPYAQSYRVYRRTSSTDWQRLDTITGTSYTDTSAKAGTTYYYTVRALRGDVLSSFVTDRSIRRLTRPSVSLSNSTSGVTISWGKVTGASGYYVYRRVSAADDWTRIKNTTGTSFTDTGAKAGTTYYYTVKAYAGSSNSTYRTDCTIRRLTRPSVSLTNSTSGVTISWGKVTGASGYYVYRRTTSGDWTRIKNTTGTSFTDTGAKSGTTYYYTVKAYAGSSNSTYRTDCTIRRLTRPSVSLTNSTSGVKISWGKVTGATSYNVYRRTTSGDWSQIKNVTGTSYTDTSAKAGTTYYYTVRARYGNTLSAYVTDKSIRRLTRPSVSLSNSTSGVKISWGKVTGATSYNVYRRTTSGNWSQIKNVTGTSYTDTSAKAGTTYYYTVRARYGNTLSAYVTDKSIRRLTRPSVSLSKTSTGVKISWGKVSGASGYYVYRRTTSGSWTRIKNTTGTSFTDTGPKKA